MTLARRFRWPWRPNTGEPVQDLAGAPIVIAYASQSGFAESLAWRSAELFRKRAVAVDLLPLEQLSLRRLQASQQVFFLVSTTGKGRAPANGRQFERELMRKKSELGGLQFAVLALGNRSYDDFCAFGRRLVSWLLRSEATSLFPTIEVDNADPAALERWQSFMLERFGSNKEGTEDSIEMPYIRWELRDRHLLNPGSSGGPVHMVRLAPRDRPPVWEAGDIATVYPAPARQHFSQGDAVAGRDYTIANLPFDNCLELLIRERLDTDGNPGMATAWLTSQAQEGDTVALRIRSNNAFHAPGGSAPLILIGNGTGIAGLRAHLKACVAKDRRANWLIYGERNEKHDSYFIDEIMEWQQSGHLSRVHRAFSRDFGGWRYVQNVIRDEADEVCRHVRNEAAILVCGSSEGMGNGVRDALTEVLGSKVLAELELAGRYRTDLY